MNIDEYRALKAQLANTNPEGEPEGEGKNAQTQSAPTEPVPSEPKEKEPSTPPVEETKPTETNPAEEAKPTEPPIEVEIDGQKLTLEELKNGYMRQSDYTRKTQEAKRKAKEAEQALQFIQALQHQPEIAQQLSEQFGLPIIDPKEQQLQKLQEDYYDLLIQNQLRDLHDKYGDFNDVEVLEIARTEGIQNLDTAFQVYKARKGGGERQETIDIETIKQQLREELMKELQAQAPVDTSTIIQGGDTQPVRDTTPTLTPQEMRVARNMGMSAEEYSKWKGIKRKR